MDKIPLKRSELIRKSDFFLDFYRTESTPAGSIGPEPHRHTFNELTLNFNNPSYFGRFFKREANMTPRQFQKQFKRK